MGTICYFFCRAALSRRHLSVQEAGRGDDQRQRLGGDLRQSGGDEAGGDAARHAGVRLPRKSGVCAAKNNIIS